MSHQTTDPYTAHVGIDWANSKHDICIQAAASEQREFGQIPHQVEAIEVRFLIYDGPEFGLCTEKKLLLEPEDRTAVDRERAAFRDSSPRSARWLP